MFQSFIKKIVQIIVFVLSEQLPLALIIKKKIKIII